MESDGACVRQVLAGKTQTFRTLVERYQDAVFGVALSMIGSFADAEEIAQEAFLSAFDSLAKLAEPERFGPWLCGIARNKARMQLRAARRREHARRRLAEAARSTPPAGSDESDRRRQFVRQALGRLPQARREAATLFYIDGYSLADISRFTRRPLGTIKRHLHESRRDLRKELLAMVEKELKRSRPRREFTENVLRKIHQVRVHLPGGEENALLLTDGRKRSFMMVIGKPEAEALQPWLEGKGSMDALDAHTALVRTLRAFGAGIEGVTVAKLKQSVFHAALALRAGTRRAELDCRPSDGINLALRAGAPIFAHKAVAQQCLMRNAAGRSLSPARAWRQLERGELPLRRKMPFYENIAQVIEALERDPEATRARMALQQAAPGFHYRPPMVKNDSGGMALLEDWAERSRKTALEGVASGLLGAVWLYSAKDPQRALPYLRRAHELVPGDDRIAFDLATACARTGQADEAFAILKNDKLTIFGTNARFLARNCGNFADLWQDPRFEQVLGRPEPRWKPACLNAQMGMRSWGTPRRARPGSGYQDWLAALGLAGWPRYLRDPKGPFKAASAPASLGRLIEQELDCGDLARIGRIAWRKGKSKGSGHVICEISPKLAVMLPLKPEKAQIIGAAVNEAPRPMTPQVFAAALGAAGITLDAAVWLRRRRWGIDAALVAHKGKRREAIAVEGPAAMAVAFVSGRPIFITKALAEKLPAGGKGSKSPEVLKPAGRFPSAWKVKVRKVPVRGPSSEKRGPK